MKSVLTIAGSDSSGGAGIQADIKTIAAHRLFAQSVITALTAQNTTGVYGIEAVSPRFVEQQIDVAFSDIRPDAVKIGMVPSPDIARAIARALARNGARHVVVDPVMVATSGSTLVEDEAVRALVELLFPLAEVVTPNVPEAQVLAGRAVDGAAAAEEAARAIAAAVPGEACAVLVKGGHAAASSDVADDVLCTAGGRITWLRGARVHTENTHGTGCTLSSAIACGLACDMPVEDAVRAAKDYVSGALAARLDLGRGSGPLDHMWQYQ